MLKYSRVCRLKEIAISLSVPFSGFQPTLDAQVLEFHQGVQYLDVFLLSARYLRISIGNGVLQMAVEKIVMSVGFNKCSGTSSSRAVGVSRRTCSMVLRVHYHWLCIICRQSSCRMHRNAVSSDMAGLSSFDFGWLKPDHVRTSLSICLTT